MKRSGTVAIGHRKARVMSEEQKPKRWRPGQATHTGSLRRGWTAGLMRSPRRSFFLRQWLSDNVPTTSASGVLPVAELTDRLFADAKALGIRSTEIEEDGS